MIDPAGGAQTARATFPPMVPEDKPFKLREFMAADLDGNLIRGFHDFGGDDAR